jgi:hypothetical protein
MACMLIPFRLNPIMFEFAFRRSAPTLVCNRLSAIPPTSLQGKHGWSKNPVFAGKGTVLGPVVANRAYAGIVVAINNLSGSVQLLDVCGHCTQATWKKPIALIAVSAYALSRITSTTNVSAAN